MRDSSWYKRGTSKPKRTYTYMQIGPSIVRLFGTKNLSKLIQDHQLKKNDISKTLNDYHDTETWK